MTMNNVTAISQRIDFEDVLTMPQVARLLHCSPPHVRALTEREWHPLPYINVGTREKMRRLFHRAVVARWFQEEIAMSRNDGKAQTKAC